MRKVGKCALALALLAACASSSSSTDSPIAVSQAVRETAPVVPSADAVALRDGNTAFAFDLQRALAKSDANLAFSPYSISLALAMTYAGARGTTATEMATALHFTLPAAQLHPAFDAVDLAITSRGPASIANSLWGSPTLTFEPTFLDTLATSYGAGPIRRDSIPGNEWLPATQPATFHGAHGDVTTPFALTSTSRVDGSSMPSGTMPKVTIAGEGTSITATLQTLGMKAAFGAGADFSAMSAEGLQIQDVVHKAFVAIDEQGSEAAAATAVALADSSVSLAPPNQAIMTLDRPFLFAIRDDATGAILFLGHVVIPS